MPGNTDSTTTFKADISQLKKAMQEAGRQVRLANSEFKAASAGMEDWSNNAKGLEAKLKQLNSTYTAQKRQMALLDDELEKTTKEYGENSAAADRVRIKINNQKAAMASTEKQLDKYEKELDDCKNGTGRFADELDDVNASSKTASDGFTVMKGALANLVADGFRLAIQAAKDLARETFNAGANFESAMSQVEAVSGASGDEMEALTAKAKEMGESTKFSASESAEAFNYMAMAGWKTEDMINGIAGIMNLAAASGEDLATTSDIVTDALTAMGYSAGDAGQLADVMAAASSNANTNVKMMGETFQYAAPLVGALGYNMEDTAVAIGLMANAGIKGQKAGTSLRAIFTRLSAPPKAAAEAMEALGISLTDTNGKMKPFSKVMQDLRKKFASLDETQQTQYASSLAGQEAMSGLLAIVNASPKDFDKLTKAVKDSAGASQDMADTMNDNVNGQITLLKSKVEGIMIKIFEKLAPTIRKAIDQVSAALDKVNWDDVANKIKNFGTQIFNAFKWVLQNGNTIKSIFAGIIAAFAISKLTGIVQGIISVIGTIRTLTTATEGATAAQTLFNAAQMATPWGLIAGLIGGVVAGLAVYAASTKDAKSETQKNREEVDKLYKSYKEMDKARNDSNKSINNEYDHLEKLKKEYNGYVDDQGKIKKKYEDRANFILNQLADAMGVERSEIEKTIGKNGKLGKSIDNLMLKKKAQAKLDANKSAYDEAINKQTEAQNKYIKAQKDADLIDQQIIDTKKKLKKAEENAANSYVQTNIGKQATAETKKYGEEITRLKASLKYLSNEQKSQAQTVEKAAKSYAGFSATVKNWEALSEASTSGNAKKIQQALTNIDNNLITSTTGNKEALSAQVKTAETKYKELQDAVKKGYAGVTQADVEAAKKLVNSSKAELSKWFTNNSEIAKKAQKAGLNIPKGIASGIKSGKIDVDTATKNIQSAIDFSKSDAVKKAKDLGVNIPKSLSTAIMSGETSVKDASKKVDAAVKFTTMAKNASGSAKKTVNAIVKQLLAGEISAEDAGKKLKEAGLEGMSGGEKEAKDSGTAKRDSFVKGVESDPEGVKAAGKNLPKNAKKGADTKDETTNSETSGNNFLQGFLRGLQNNKILNAIFGAGKNAAKKGKDGLKKGGKEGSPWKTTLQSGAWFSEGFINGINSLSGEIFKTAYRVGAGAVTSLQDAQEEHSPSKLTYKSGVNFTKGYINGISSMQKNLVKTVKGLVKTVTKELLNLNNFNFSEVANKASSAFSDTISKKISYMTDKIAYQNEQKLAKFDSTISSLEKKRDKKVASLEKARDNKLEALQDKKNKAKSKKAKNNIQKQINDTKKSYNKQINSVKNSYGKLIKEQNKFKNAYQKASSEMLEEFNSALSEYQSKAQALIDDTINGITDTYQARYDELINKQDTLISKLKSAGDLFEISGAGVITVNDIKEQTKQIKDYAEKLKTIKAKVSSELFDQIASYDMKEGQAFIEQLLGMSDAELKAYNEAYSEKMSLAESLSKDIYKQDFDKVASDYKNAINKAMAGLPKQLEELGNQVMKGFVNGLTQNTDYMSKSIKTLVKGMVATFKKELKIKSPSRVMMGIGEYTGEGFADGLKNTIGEIKQTVSSIVDTATQSLEGVKSPLSNVKANVSPNNGIGATGGNVVNNYNLVQNNNSPKALTALETYRARRQQIAMVKAATETV